MIGHATDATTIRRNLPVGRRLRRGEGWAARGLTFALPPSSITALIGIAQVVALIRQRGRVLTRANDGQLARVIRQEG